MHGPLGASRARGRVAGENVGGVVVDEQPLPVASLEDVGGQDRRHRDVAAGLGQDVLGAGDPAEAALHERVDVGDAEAHLLAVLEDDLPGVPHRLPAREHAPARVHAAHVVLVGPDLVHLAEIEGLEDAVEARVRLLQLGAAGRLHGEVLPDRSRLGKRGGRARTARGPSWYDERAMPASPLAVEARDLAKTFRSGWLRRRETAALRGASLQVPRGAIYGLLGPNGAGKTTLLSILATLLLPDSGSATILGHDVVREAFAIRRRLNMASGNASFVWSLRPAEVLAFYGRLYGLHGRVLKRRVSELLERFELVPHLKTEY